MKEQRDIFIKGKPSVITFIETLLEFLLFGDICLPRIEDIAADCYLLVMLYDEVFFLI
jgi:hypothetical protein